MMQTKNDHTKSFRGFRAVSCQWFGLRKSAKSANQSHKIQSTRQTKSQDFRFYVSAHLTDVSLVFAVFDLCVFTVLGPFQIPRKRFSFVQQLDNISCFVLGRYGFTELFMRTAARCGLKWSLWPDTAALNSRMSSHLTTWLSESRGQKRSVLDWKPGHQQHHQLKL